MTILSSAEFMLFPAVSGVQSDTVQKVRAEGWLDQGVIYILPGISRPLAPRQTKEGERTVPTKKLKVLVWSLSGKEPSQ